MAEALVNTPRRDYIVSADRSSAADVIERVPSGWIADYNSIAPHSALGLRSPQQYRAEVLQTG